MKPSERIYEIYRNSSDDYSHAIEAYLDEQYKNNKEVSIFTIPNSSEMIGLVRDRKPILICGVEYIPKEDAPNYCITDEKYLCNNKISIRLKEK